ncbi:hypothetical protein HDU92_000927, partial [Lobulomyces angularis]
DKDKKNVFESYLPKKCFDIQRPVGVINCRNVNMVNDNDFLTNLQKPGESKYLILPSSAAGPDISYSLFHCGVKTTWTSNSATSMFVKNVDCKKNLDSLTPDLWYKKWLPSKKKCEEILMKNKDSFVLISFNLPSASSTHLEAVKVINSESSSNKFILVELESEFAKLFFGETFINRYREYVKAALNK